MAVYMYDENKHIPILINISMLLSIQKEKEAITSEIKLLNRTIYKLSNQMRHFKELNQIKIIIKNIRKYF